MAEYDRPVKILLVEDNPGDVRLFREMLEEFVEAFDIEHVARFSAGMKSLDASDEFDVVVLDLSLPDSQGLDSLLAVQEEAPQIPVVVLSGSGNERMAMEAVKLGAQDYLVKGEVTERMLVRSIRYAVERERAERRLRRQKELLENALESLTHPFYVVNAHDYTIEIANSAAADAKSLEALPDNATCYAVTHQRKTPCGETACPCPLEEVKVTKAPVTLEHIHYDAGGNPRTVEVHGYPIFDDEGNVVQMIEYTLDITERKQAEEALRRERDLIARLMDTSPVSITMVNRQGEIVFANERAEEVLGLTREEITARTYNTPNWRMSGFDGGPFPDEQLPFRQVMETQQPVYDVRHAIEWPNGQRRLLSINGAPLCDEAGNVERVVFAIEDVTDQVRAEEARIAQLERELESLERIATLSNAQISARSFGLVPLRESHPTVLEELVERYERLMDAALERKVYKVEDIGSEEVMAMAERLGSLRAGPRDVIDVHIAALKNKSRQSNPVKVEAYAEEGRLLALKLMGELTSYYRTRCVYVMRSDDAIHTGSGTRKG